MIGVDVTRYKRDKHIIQICSHFVRDIQEVPGAQVSEPMQSRH